MYKIKLPSQAHIMLKNVIFFLFHYNINVAYAENKETCFIDLDQQSDVG